MSSSARDSTRGARRCASACTAPSRGQTRCGARSRTASIWRRSTCTGCPKSSARASPANASRAGRPAHLGRSFLPRDRRSGGTGEPVADGEPGELVLTSLTKEALPIIRYRTHDLTRLLAGHVALDAADREGHRAHRRHADHPRGQSVPEPGRELILKEKALSPHYVLEVYRASISIRWMSLSSLGRTQRRPAREAGVCGEPVACHQILYRRERANPVCRGRRDRAFGRQGKAHYRHAPEGVTPGRPPGNHGASRHAGSIWRTPAAAGSHRPVPADGAAVHRPFYARSPPCAAGAGRPRSGPAPLPAAGSPPAWYQAA